MRPGGGKAKGSAFERLVCKQLSLWVSQGLEEDLFWRSAMSGGRATVGRRKGKDLRKHAGDISATSRAGHALTDTFFIECKFVKDLRLGQFVQELPSVIGNFWQVACDQAKDHNKAAMLIAKQNGGRIIVMMMQPDAMSYGWGRKSVLFSMRSHIAVLDYATMLIEPFTMRVR